MNQILVNKQKNNKIKYIFKVQFIISIVIAIILIGFVLLNYNNEENLEELSKVINKKIEIASVYNIEKVNIESDSQILGKIYIDKIDLEYSIFKDINEEYLKISPCKFYGVGLGEKGNICIART